MSFEPCSCHLPACDRCGPECWHAETDGPPHLGAPNAAALEVLRYLYRWWCERQPDGTLLMLCPDCAAEMCDEQGHLWREAELDPEAPQPAQPIEMCRRCSTVRRDHEPLDAPPPGSPESKTELLDRDLEWLLAEIEDAEWPADGDDDVLDTTIDHYQASKEH